MATQTPPSLPFSPQTQDAWDEIQQKARAIPPMPHFWAAGKHGGFTRRQDLKYGFELMRTSVGGFGGYVVNALPTMLTLAFFALGFAAGIMVDFERPGGIVGPDCSIVDGRLVGDYGCQLTDSTATLWSIWHTMIFAIAMGAFGYILGYYVWQPMTWYNQAWGDCIAIQENNGVVEALTRTKIHRLCFAKDQSEGYYRGNARDGHIARARILLRYEPAQKDEFGNVTGGWHANGLAGALMTDLYTMRAGTGHSTDDPGRAYETLRVRMYNVAERARRINQRGYNRFWKLENGMVILGVAMLCVGALLMLSIIGGGDPIVDHSTITNTVGLSNGG